MTERRLYASSLPEDGGVVVLSEAPSRHVRVLRLKVGDEVVLFDGHGREARARIRTIGEAEVVCQAEPPDQARPRRARLVLMLAVPKGSKIGDCVRMATELGVDEVALMRTERTVPRWDSDRVKSRVARLTRIASEAAAQSERSDVPVIHSPKPCDAWLEQVPVGALKVVFGARAGGRFGALTELPEQIWCAIGPEGGFTDAELKAFRGAGFHIVSLGDLVLRVETAVPVVMALMRDRVADLVQPR